MKPLDDFAWRRIHKGQRDTYCRPCRSAYKQEHYATNKQRYVANAAARKRRVAEENVALLFAYFESHPCTDCGEDDPLVLEFDHVANKNFLIARAIRERAWREIEAEIQLCEVVCANCHRRRTASRGGWIRAVAAANHGLQDVALTRERALRLSSRPPPRV